MAPYIDLSFSTHMGLPPVKVLSLFTYMEGNRLCQGFPNWGWYDKIGHNLGPPTCPYSGSAFQKLNYSLSGEGGFFQVIPGWQPTLLASESPAEALESHFCFFVFVFNATSCLPLKTGSSMPRFLPAILRLTEASRVVTSPLQPKETPHTPSRSFLCCDPLWRTRWVVALRRLENAGLYE